LCIAQICVPASGSKIIKTAQIYDRRPYSSECGWVIGVVEQLDTSGIFDEYKEQFDELMQQIEDEINNSAIEVLRGQIQEMQPSYASAKLSGTPQVYFTGKFNASKRLVKAFNLAAFTSDIVFGNALQISGNLLAVNRTGYYDFNVKLWNSIAFKNIVHSDEHHPYFCIALVSEKKDVVKFVSNNSYRIVENDGSGKYSFAVPDYKHGSSEVPFRTPFFEGTKRVYFSEDELCDYHVCVAVIGDVDYAGQVLPTMDLASLDSMDIAVRFEAFSETASRSAGGNVDSMSILIDSSMGFSSDTTQSGGD
jgi:hypothetical protein